MSAIKRAGLCVGLPFVDKAAYDGSDMPCQGCDVDALDFSRVLEAAGFSTTLLLNDQATRFGVLSALRAEASRLEAGDLFVMSIAGHGAQMPVPEDGNRLHEFWCLWDGMMIDDDVIAAVKMFRAGVRIVMVNDQCHCGGIFTSERGDLPMLIQFAACRAEQSSIGTHIGGTWTTALMKVLAVDREISWRQWFNRAVEHPSLTKNQTPQWIEVGPVSDDFRNAKIFESGGMRSGENNSREANMSRSIFSGFLDGTRNGGATANGTKKRFCRKCGSLYWAEASVAGDEGCPVCKKNNHSFADPSDAEPRATKKFCRKCGKYTWVEGNYTGSCQYCGASFGGAAPTPGSAPSLAASYSPLSASMPRPQSTPPSSFGKAAAAIRAAVSMPAVAPACTPELFNTSPNELLQLMQYVCSSPHVTSNAQYASLPERLVFAAEANVAMINAFATIKDGNKPVIMLLGGAIRFANLVSAAYVGSMAARSGGEQNPLPEITAALGRFCLECKANLSGEQACRFAEQYNLHLVVTDPTLGRKARSFAAGLLIGILAHEFGHLALGHCYGKRVNLEVSRNQEREADSFASSVISSSPFGDYLVFGTILWEAVWVWVEEATGQVATTHPLSRERLADLIRANPSVAAEFGLNA